MVNQIKLHRLILNGLQALELTYEKQDESMLMCKISYLFSSYRGIARKFKLF